MKLKQMFEYKSFTSESELLLFNNKSVIFQLYRSASTLKQANFFALLADKQEITISYSLVLPNQDPMIYHTQGAR